jgi:AAA15 family ATPase/GTPase
MEHMINNIKLNNFGPLSHINWSELGKINLIIGGNGSGKTFLLKAIYSSLRTLEDYKRGNEQRSASDILADKLYWTFQAEKIGDLVSTFADQVANFFRLKCPVQLWQRHQQANRQH